MGDVPPPKNAFDVLMAPTPPPKVEGVENDPVLTMVLYEAHLEHADESEPLWRVSYFGQIVRVGTAEELLTTRKREHELSAARENKDLGLHAVVNKFGPDAIAWRIVSFKSGPRTAMQELANAEEVRIIDENGGVLRDMNRRLVQTLNLTKGGLGYRGKWVGIDARRRRVLTKFKVNMEKYVEEHGSSLVPTAYVNEDGYQLGLALNTFRKRTSCSGMPEEADIKAWAEALPRFAWNARKTDEFRGEKREHATNQHATERRAELERARLIVVPFEKIKKRRVEMRAATTNFSGKMGSVLLYMVSGDGKTIRRVAKNGDIGSRFIVGPVVDPKPPDVFDSDSD